MTNYKITKEQLSTEYTTKSFSTYYERALTLHEIVEEKLRLSNEMIDNYMELIDEYKDDNKMIKSIDLLYDDEKFNAIDLRIVIPIVEEIVTTCAKILEEDDLSSKFKLVDKFIMLINSANMIKYKKFIFGY